MQLPSHPDRIRPLPPLMVRSFYRLKPFMPRGLQIYLRKKLARKIRLRAGMVWPMMPGSQQLPEGWDGWKNGKRFALVLTHDVDTQKGYDDHRTLLELEQKMGFVSSFNFVPERYRLNQNDLREIQQQGFEVGVHGLKHDGRLFESYDFFLQRAEKINAYLKAWDSVGFRAPAMHHRLEWIHALNITYDASTFDTDPFEPQADGVHTIFPFWVASDSQSGSGFWELPYTLPQDFTLFVILGETSIDIWRKKLDWIARHGGMALINTHPDYMHFGTGLPASEQYPADYYRMFLEMVKTKYAGEYWNPAANELAGFLSERSSENADKKGG